MSNKSMVIYAEGVKRRQQEEKEDQAVTPKNTSVRDNPRDFLREGVSQSLDKSSRQARKALPSRDDIQELSFRLRYEVKVKVQAEVPVEWKAKLEKIAFDLKIGKVELYRFILGEFLGQIERKGTSPPIQHKNPILPPSKG